MAQSEILKYKYDRIPYIISFEEKSEFKDTYAGEIGRVVLESHLLRPREKPSDTVIIMMHPIGGGQYLPLTIALAKAGFHVIYCNSRYKGDSALIMEKVAIDMGACVRDAKERLGYDKVVLGGWSGGGSLSLFYQAEAEDPKVKLTPAGEGPDLSAQGLIPADGIMMLAAHVSRAVTLTEWMDASILDESDPTKKDPDLDLYNPANPNQPPYTEEFVARYREAQIARNRRITAWVKEKLAEIKASDMPDREQCFLVEGTMADPRWLDPKVDPNDRQENWCYLGVPEVVNSSPVGLARFTSLRSWLSQFSYDESNAIGPDCAARITVPLLSIGNSADDGCTPSHTHRLFDAVSHDNKQLTMIEGATHYYFGQPDKVEEAAGICRDWMHKQGFGL